MTSKIFRYKFLYLLGGIVFFLSCGNEDQNGISGKDNEGNEELNENYLFLQQQGLNSISVQSDEDTYTFLLTVKRSGNTQKKVNAQLIPWEEEEIEAYNRKEGFSYAILPKNLYTAPREICLEAGKIETTLSISFNPVEVFAELKKTQAEYIIPLKLKSSDIAVKETQCNLLLSIYLDAPVVRFGTFEKTLYVQESTAELPITAILDYKVDGKAVASPWKFSAKLIIPDNASELVTTYNQAHNVNYELLPQESYHLPQEFHYNIGDTEATTIVEITGEQMEMKHYLLPLQLSEPSAKEVMSNSKVIYCFISRSYNNPVISVSVPDPTAIRAEDGYFYLYGTEDIYNMPVYRSRNMVNWEYMGTAFTKETRPNWREGHSLWAPEIRYFDGHYVLYYSFAKWGDEWDSNVGVAVADNPLGPFHDKGALILAKEMLQNSIDPFYYEADGKKYMFWGSFSGINATELTEDGLAVKRDADGKPVLNKRICGNRFEATNIYKRGEYYYLFASIGTCCNGANSTYTTVVGRSKEILGPYLDKTGGDMLFDHYEVVVEGNSVWAGPGHNSILQIDDSGTEWLLYHGYKKAQANEGRVVLLDRLQWTEDGWPYVKGKAPSVTDFMPVIKK